MVRRRCQVGVSVHLIRHVSRLINVEINHVAPLPAPRPVAAQAIRQPATQHRTERHRTEPHRTERHRTGEHRATEAPGAQDADSGSWAPGARPRASPPTGSARMAHRLPGRNNLKRHPFPPKSRLRLRGSPTFRSPPPPSQPPAPSPQAPRAPGPVGPPGPQAPSAPPGHPGPRQRLQALRPPNPSRPSGPQGPQASHQAEPAWSRPTWVAGLSAATAPPSSACCVGRRPDRAWLGGELLTSAQPAPAPPPSPRPPSPSQPRPPPSRIPDISQTIEWLSGNERFLVCPDTPKPPH